MSPLFFLSKMDIQCVEKPTLFLSLEEPFKHWEISKAILYQEPTKAEYLRKDVIFIRLTSIFYLNPSFSLLPNQPGLNTLPLGTGTMPASGHMFCTNPVLGMWKDWYSFTLF